MARRRFLALLGMTFWFIVSKHDAAAEEGLAAAL
jgi:hypothetical protein